jgi:L-threonylcarbamoyladenylate synthase
MKYKHYAPHAELFLFEGEKKRIAAAMRSFMISMKGKRKVGVLATESSSRHFKDTAFVSLGRTGASEAARRLFAGLREMDKRRVDVILCEGFPAQSIGIALMNRLRKAATRRIRV